MQTGQLNLVEKYPTLLAKKKRARIHIIVWMPITAAKKTILDRISSNQLLAATVVISLLLHYFLASGFQNFRRDAEIKTPVKNERIEFAVVEKVATPKPVDIVKIEKPITPVKPIEVKPEPIPQTIPESIAPPPNEEAQQETQPTEIVGGITESSTSDNGSFSVAAGNTLYAPPPEVAPAAEEIKPYKAKEYAPFHMIAVAPAYRQNVSFTDLQKLYPDEARRLGIEKKVTVKLLIDDDGTVVKVTVTRDPGYGFAEAAEKLARQMLFSPATVNGSAVATEIPFTLKFTLE